MKISRKNLRLIYLFLLIIGLVACIVNNAVLSFGLTILYIILIILSAGISFFSELSFIIWYAFLQGFIHRVIGISGSTLAWAGDSMPFYFEELTIATISYLLTSLFFIWFTSLIRDEKKLYKNGTKLRYHTSVILLMVGMILVVLVFPSFPTFKMNLETRRTQGLSGLYGFLILALVLLSATIDNSYKHKSFNYIYAFVTFWIIGHGERVELLGFLSYYAIKLLNRLNSDGIKKRIARHKKVAIYGGGAVMLIIAMWLGMTRDTSNSKVSLLLILYNLIVQPTCGDIVYVFNCAVDLWKTGQAVHGLTYLDYIMQLIPGATNKFSAAVVITETYFTMGGGLFFTEPMMNFGIIGVILSNVEFYMVMRLVFKKCNSYRAFFVLPIIMEVFRTAWYGRSGWILCAFIEVPIIYFGIHVFLQKRVGYRKRKENDNI